MSDPDFSGRSREAETAVDEALDRRGEDVVEPEPLHECTEDLDHVWDIDGEAVGIRHTLRLRDGQLEIADVRLDGGVEGLGQIRRMSLTRAVHVLLNATETELAEMDARGGLAEPVPKPPKLRNPDPDLGTERESVASLSDGLANSTAREDALEAALTHALNLSTDLARVTAERDASVQVMSSTRDLLSCALKRVRDTGSERDMIARGFCTVLEATDLDGEWVSEDLAFMFSEIRVVGRHLVTVRPPIDAGRICAAVNAARALLGLKTEPENTITVPLSQIDRVCHVCGGISDTTRIRSYYTQNHEGSCGDSFCWSTCRIISCKGRVNVRACDACEKGKL